MKRNITAKDIAKRCGVSQATVSYVINDCSSQKISEETKHKVLEAIREMNYFPNRSARNMRNKSSTSIGIVCATDYSRQAFLESFEGISEYFDKIHYTLTIFNEDNQETPPAYVQGYGSNLIDGLIFISNYADHTAFLQPAIENNIPYVVLCMDGVFSSHSPVPHSFDHALEECALYCREHSLRQIRYFSVDHQGRFVNHKFPEFREALGRIYPEGELEHVVCPVEQRSHQNILPYLEEYMSHNTFDIAISQNYDIGLIVQKFILKRGFSVPQKIKHILLNYVDFYHMNYPSLSGIFVPYREMGTYAARMLLAIIEGEEGGFLYREFDCRIIHNDSSAF